MKSIKMIIKRMILDMKSIVSGLAFGFFLFLIPLMMIMVVVVFAPAGASFQVVIVGSTSIITATTYGSISGNYRNSSLYLNSRLNKADNFITNISDILISIFGGYVAFSILLLYNELFNINDMILDFGVWGDPYREPVFSLFGLNAKEFGFLLFSIFESLVIITSIGFFSFRFFRSTKVYYIVVLSFIILDIIFGGIFNNYFGMRDSIGGEYTVPSFGLNGAYNMFPNYIYVPSLLFPLYAPSQHLIFVINRIEYYQKGGEHTTHYFVWLNSSNIADIGIENSVFIECFTGNILGILPGFYSGLFFLLGISKTKRRH